MICKLYKQHWLNELKEPDSIAKLDKSERRRYSRYIFTCGFHFSKEPPFCRYGYICSGCYDINKCWYESMVTDDYFRVFAQKYLENMRALRPDLYPTQLTLF